MIVLKSTMHAIRRNNHAEINEIKLVFGPGLGKLIAVLEKQGFFDEPEPPRPLDIHAERERQKALIAGLL